MFVNIKKNQKIFSFYLLIPVQRHPKMKRNEHLVMFFKINKKKKKFFFLTCGISYSERLEIPPKKKKNEQLVMLVNKKKLKKFYLLLAGIMFMVT
jgi:hypothetical protein